MKHNAKRTRSATGFTLIEMMIVVTIVGILAVIAGSAFRKYGDTARAAEAAAMLSEFRMKEEAYRAENSIYLSTGASESSLYPSLLNSGEPSPKTVTRPATWVTLGVNPNRSQLYCGYVIVAGAANVAIAGSIGSALFSGATPTTQNWYGLAVCNNDGSANDITATNNTNYITSSTSTAVVTKNEHK